MPEYLAPGVYVEEVSYRSKSIEGVSTTTTGFVGPARYGPTETEPDVLTSLLDFERVYGDRRQLVWNDGQYHNYLWHAVRAFFEEGGKRLYVARVFRPLTGEEGDTETAVYEPPKSSLKEDRVRCGDSRLYEQDGHARLWLTKETAVIRAVARRLQEVLTALDTTQGQATLAKQRAENAARTAEGSNGAGSDVAAAALRSAEKAQKLFSEVHNGFGKAQLEAALAASALPAGTLPNTLLDASSDSGNAMNDAQRAVDEATLRAAGAITPATAEDAFWAADYVVNALKNMSNTAGTGYADSAVNQADAVDSMIPASFRKLKEMFDHAMAAVRAVKTAITATEEPLGASVLANTAKAASDEARRAYQNHAVDLPSTMESTAGTTEDAAIALEESVNKVVAAAVTALDKVVAAETQSQAASGLPENVLPAAAESRRRAGLLLDSARDVAAAAQEFRAKASGALARAQVAQDLMSKLDQAADAADAALTAFTDPTNGVVAKASNANTLAGAVTVPDDIPDEAPPGKIDLAIKDLQSAASEAQQLVDDTAKPDAGTAQQCVTKLKEAVASAKTALQDNTDDKLQLVQQAKDKLIAATAALDKLVSTTNNAEDKIIASLGLADQLVTLVTGFGMSVPTDMSDAKKAAGEAKEAIVVAKDKVGDAFDLFQATVVPVNALPGSFTTAAVKAAADSAHGAVLKLEELEKTLRDAAKTVWDAETGLANIVALYAGAAVEDMPPEEPHEAILLRARFPGAYGNLPICFSLRLGDNLLRGPTGKAKAAGLQDGDFVWIGTQAAPGLTIEDGELLLATLDEDTKEWRFGPDTEEVRYWLNRGTDTSNPQLDPATQFLRVATIAVTIDSGGGIPETWEGLALQPTHTRAGAPDSLTAKFSPEPASAADARMLPIVILADDSLTTAGALFKTLFSRFDTTLALPPGQNKLDVDLTLIGGNDGQRPGAGEYEGREKEHGKTGLKALEDLDDIAIVAAPGSTYGLNDGYRSDAESILNLTISHAERMRYRIAVLDSGNNQTIGEVRSTCAKLDSKYAALYYPWVKILDPVTRKEIYLPPSGFVTGIYARNDITRAVYKAPANEVVNLALGFEITLNKSQQDVLNPLGVNCFRYFPGRGYRLWGARTLSSDPEWKYVNLRRYFAYVEHSIDKSTQWAVFEPNGERLWDNVRRTIYDFLLNEWQNGALLGEKPEKAFFVRCDRSTMTQNDLDNGRLVCQIGIAPLRPAEYVIFRVGQWTADRKA